MLKRALVGIRSGFTPSLLCVLLALSLVTAGCGGSSDPDYDTGDPGPSEPTPDPRPEPTPEPTPEEPACDIDYESTYDAIQAEVFDAYCTSCHNENALGGLDLSPGVSFGNLFEVESVSSDLQRVHPGDEQRSYLWSKVAAHVDDSILISGGMMPPSGPLPENLLDLLRVWITSGAPEDEVLVETEDLIDACLPDPEPFEIKPLDPPAPGEGVQFVMPAYTLPPASEVEICFATYEDVCDQVPDEFKTADGNFLLYDTFEIRQNVGSHHLLIQSPAATLGGQDLDPNELDGWACRGGEFDGETCDPLDMDFCGEGGTCATPVVGTTACIGYPHARGINPVTFVGTQQPQLRTESHPGVYSFAPCRTVMFWNSHAFNLTATEGPMRARLNFEFADDRRYIAQRTSTDGPGLGNFGIPRLAAQGAAPYTIADMCSNVTLPKGARLTELSSHTHKRGDRSWWTNPAGELVYENRIYNDPPTTIFDPPIELDSDDDADRTYRFCTTFNNGVDKDGNPDPEAVTRASRIPYGVGGPGTTGFGTCEPKACVNDGADFTINCDDGQNNRKGDDAACDTSPGAGDGLCDACQIMGGVTTENEMFQGSLSYFMVE